MCVAFGELQNESEQNQEKKQFFDERTFMLNQMGKSNGVMVQEVSAHLLSDAYLCSQSKNKV